VILIAGKGHESYQESAGIKLPFSDKAHAQMALGPTAETTIAAGATA
jgi:UDP-N-acetylmuramoyl-L-alanyl-D-glutamate--2,6-diaminopimelate ligase